ncbi:hypothetical protein GKZ28_19870 [Clostridium chromiireducens]|uniref:Uncharacterized protein n=1 Tax=Clostridium chromiireducens TaxID=225345 RepID=A0A964RQN9_9CLOT|nr:hypothetical protein [Clostridium chromiireducens]MVX65940.1 hypothetical protein [Clostridium chromiireducens]
MFIVKIIISECTKTKQRTQSACQNSLVIIEMKELGMMKTGNGLNRNNVASFRSKGKIKEVGMKT